MDEGKNNLDKFSKKMENVGRGMQRVGCAMTLMFTIPIIGLVFFGFIGFLVGALIGVVGIVSMFSNKK